MHLKYHRQILAESLHGLIGKRPLDAIIEANLGQDTLPNQIGHDEYHFDNNAFLEGKLYVWRQMRRIRPALRRGQVTEAWAAFGRLTHAIQDLYAHSNYVALWLRRTKRRQAPPPEAIVPADLRILRDSRLRSGRLYYPLEALSFIPWIGRLVVPFLPPDAHAHMNLDGPERGPLFNYAMQAARKHTLGAFWRVMGWLKPAERLRFTQNRL